MHKTAVSTVLAALIEYEILNVLSNGPKRRQPSAGPFPVSADYNNPI